MTPAPLFFSWPSTHQVSESRVVECPSIQITTISPDDDPPPAVSTYWEMGSAGGGGGGGWDRERLYLPLLDPFSYRDKCPGSLSPSPASSPSSRGWLSPASSCDSLLVEEEELSEATINFGLSPSSRPTSPSGKKRRNSPLASPCTSRRGSYSDDLQGCNLDGGDSSASLHGQHSGCELSIPQKTRKTSLEQVRPSVFSKSPDQGRANFWTVGLQLVRIRFLSDVTRETCVSVLLCLFVCLFRPCSVVPQGGGPGAGSRPQLSMPATRDAADQTRASICGHGLPLCAPRPGLGPHPSQCPQPSVQARPHTSLWHTSKKINKIK